MGNPASIVHGAISACAAAGAANAWAGEPLAVKAAISEAPHFAHAESHPSHSYNKIISEFRVSPIFSENGGKKIEVPKGWFKLLDSSLKRLNWAGNNFSWIFDTIEEDIGWQLAGPLFMMNIKDHAPGRSLQSKYNICRAIGYLLKNARLSDECTDDLVRILVKLALPEEDYRTRIHAIGAFEMIGPAGKSAISQLRDIMEQEEERGIRIKIDRAISEIRGFSEDALPEFIARLESEKSPDKLIEILDILRGARLHAKDAMQAISKVARSNKNGEVRMAAIEAMNKIKGWRRIKGG